MKIDTISDLNLSAQSAPSTPDRRRLLNTALKLATSAALLSLVSGCGQKGPLFLPDSDTGEEDKKKKSS